MSRRALLLGSVAAMAPAVLIASHAAAAPGGILQRFAPPSEPMVLTRTLVRTLRDGKEIVVRRSYAVRFTANGDGYLLEGHQIEASVDAPAKLASLADIERSRIDEDMFPIRLDAAGQIAAPQHKPGLKSPAHDAAVRQSHRLVDQSKLSPALKQEAHQQVTQLGAASADGEDWPADLFSPLATDRTQRQRFALPDGGVDEVEVSIRIVGKADSGIPARVERTVTTVISGDSRISREVWTLGPANRID